MSDNFKCTKCKDTGSVTFYSPTMGRNITEFCDECLGVKQPGRVLSEKAINAGKALGQIPQEPKPALEIYAFPVDQEELRLIKLALFEISEYLGSPKLATLRQRVQSMMNNTSVKLPADSIFNAEEFRKCGSEWANGKLINVTITKEPV